MDNFNFYKQILIEGLASKSHFSDVFSTWNREVFPRSLAPEVVPDSRPASRAGCGAIDDENHLKLDNVADIFRQLSFEQNNPTSTSGTGPDHSTENDSDVSDFYVPYPPQPRSTEAVESQPHLNQVLSESDPITADPIPTPNTLLEPLINPTRPLRSRSSKAPTAAKKVPAARTSKAKDLGSSTAIPSTTQEPLDHILTDPGPTPPKPKRAGRAKTRAG